MNPNSILNYLEMISNKNVILNVMLHVAVIISLVSVYFLKDEKVKKYLFNGTLLALVLSVTANALVFGNPFHAVTFGMMTVTAAIEIVKGKGKIGVPKNDLNTIISFAFIFIGLWYPEFVKVSKLESLLAAPTGIVPCPTILTVLGMLNLYYPNVNRLQFITSVVFAMIYGVIGTFVLGVKLDLSLIAAFVYSIVNMVINRTIINYGKINSKY